MKAVPPGFVQERKVNAMLNLCLTPVISNYTSYVKHWNEAKR
jgi:hypothetical protein